MVFLNGNFIDKDKAYVSVMDRGFLFGDGVYEVIPVYQGKIFHLKEHLNRLQKSLNSIQITNPYSINKWSDILGELIQFSSTPNQSVYLQITRGADTQRKHGFNALTPMVYIESNELITKSKAQLEKGFSALTQNDIRWHRCDIKSISLLPNILYAQFAKQQKVQEIILCRDNKITEGATSNVFILKGDTLFTHPTGGNILAGITRGLVINSAKACGLNVQETAFPLSDIAQADGLWISSSTRELMPITKLNNKPIAKAKISPYWYCVYDYYQQLKND